MDYDASNQVLNMYDPQLGFRSIVKTQTTFMKPHDQITRKLGFETFEEYHEGALLSSGFKGQEIRVSHPLMNIQAKPLAFYPLTNPSFTSQTL